MNTKDGLLKRFPGKRLEKLELAEEIIDDINHLERMILSLQQDLNKVKNNKDAWWVFPWMMPESLEHRINIKKSAIRRLEIRLNNLLESTKYLILESAEAEYFEAMKVKQIA